MRGGKIQFFRRRLNEIYKDENVFGGKCFKNEGDIIFNCQKGQGTLFKLL